MGKSFYNISSLVLLPLDAEVYMYLKKEHSYCYKNISF